MLKELPASHSSGEPARRWFASDDLELIVWLDADAAISGFQLCYKTAHAEHALTWTRERSYHHDRIDDGEADPTKNQTPILVADGVIDVAAIRTRFAQCSAAIDPLVRDFVLEKLRQLPAR
jgi:hypothetical protein